MCEIFWHETLYHLQDFLEGQGDFEGIDDLDASASAASKEDQDLMSLASSGSLGKDIELEEQGIWKEMQRILKLEEDGHAASDTPDDKQFADQGMTLDSDEDSHSSSEGIFRNTLEPA